MPLTYYACCTKDHIKKLISVFVGLFLLGVILGLVPLLFKSPSHDIGPDSEKRKLYTEPSNPIEFKIYIFNITNTNEVTAGAKPMLQEVGSYVFDEWSRKFDVADNDVDDTLTFNMKKSYIFRPDLSNGLSGNEEITTVNALLMGMSLAVNVDKKPMLKMINKAINSIWHHPKHPFWTGRAMDYLFDGIEIDCTSDEFAAKAVCSVFETGEVGTVQPVRENFFKFSAFGSVNGSDIGMYTIDRGIKNISNVGRIVRFDGKPEMDVWVGDECNRYNGTDSTVFPPGVGKEDGLWFYEPALCLSIGAQYESDASYQGVPTLRFALDLGDVTKNEELQCYCFAPPDDCPRRGTINLFDCISAPIVVSLPHFYRADPSLLAEVQSGLRPTESLHSFYIDYEPTTGIVTNAAKRLQFNLDVMPIPEVESMKRVPKVLMPLLWIEQGSSSSFNSELNAMVQQHQQELTLQIFQWIAISAGGLGLICSTLIYLKIRRDPTVVYIKKTDDKVDDSNADVYKVPAVSVF